MINVIAQFNPISSAPIADSIHIKGGYKSVADNTARDAIPATRRSEGMEVRVLTSGLTYVLQSNLTTWLQKSGSGAPILVSPTYGTTTTVNCNVTDLALITATGDITTLTVSGTPVNGQRLRLRITASGGTWTVNFDATHFYNSTDNEVVVTPYSIPSGTMAKFVLEWETARGKWSIESGRGGF